MEFKKTARRSQATRSALLAFLVVFLLCVGLDFLGTIATFKFGEDRITHRGHIWSDKGIIGDAYDEELRQELQNNKSAIIVEFEWRKLIPSSWQPECFSSNATVCELTDLFYTAPEEPGELPWWMNKYWLWFIVVPGLVSLAIGFAVWFAGGARTS
jgi:hypothetical protein